MQVWKANSDKSDEQSTSVDHDDVAVMPSRAELVTRVAAFKKALELTPQQVRELEINTKDQAKSQLWYFARRYRLTASSFGRIFQMLPTTPPGSLVKHLLHPKDF